MTAPIDWLEWAKELIEKHGVKWLYVDPTHNIWISKNFEKRTHHPHIMIWDNFSKSTMNEARLEYAIREAIEAEGWSYEHRYYKNVKLHFWIVDKKHNSSSIESIEALATAYLEAMRGKA